MESNNLLPEFVNSTVHAPSLDRTFGALSDGNRRVMLAMLARSAKTVKELGEGLGISKQLASKHLKVLEGAGLIKKTQEGRLQRCQLEPRQLEAAQALIREYQTFWENRFDQLEEFIEKTKKGESET